MALETLVLPPPEPPVTPIMIGLFCMLSSVILSVVYSITFFTKFIVSSAKNTRVFPLMFDSFNESPVGFEQASARKPVSLFPG
ncbi:Uncharacterised protein [Streptococcus pneumoniae]|nr:Uncharacterised protein [Streptococcus pneumoniae]CJE49224.1 Uncharacterised protein [Streptococcus pneumoniae]CJH58013.1 Uncharacterised protein [Streptococcus pneumoniae]CKG08889.1 Uncharacterised protein [Streptococcus pneumoniae]